MAGTSPAAGMSAPRIDRGAFRRNRQHKSAVNAEQAETASRTAIVLGGGAPNMALMAGALAAFSERGITFDVVSTSGAGALAGLLWLAPKGAAPADALRAVTTMSVADSIYRWFPVNYKVFNKPGPVADLWRAAVAANPFLRTDARLYETAAPYAIWSDLQAFVLAALTPSGLGAGSLGLCAPPPFAEAIIDFDRLKAIAPYFYMNAYNIDAQRIDDFSKEVITADHFRAALAFPFIYGPYTLDGTRYYEGAVVNCLNFKDLVERHPGLERVVVFDVLGSDDLIRAPRDLYDSWVLSLVIPLVKTAEDNLELFELKHKPPGLDVHKLRFDVPERDLPEVLDWSESNARRLFDIGMAAGHRYADEVGGGEGAVPQKR